MLCSRVHGSADSLRFPQMHITGKVSGMSDVRSEPPEELLPGGNLSAAVKVGDTVRRRAGPWTPAVHALLAHLRRVGFDAAPEPLGVDDQGRAILSFLPGEVHSGWPEPRPQWVFEDEATLVGAAQLLRRYHDAVADFEPPYDAQWAQVAPGKHELICHNDWAPGNALFDEHRPVAMLDWDSAGPGSRAWDLAYSAYTWVPLDLKSEPDLERSALRLRLFCDAYGGHVPPADVLEALPLLLRVGADRIQARAEGGDPGFQKLVGWNFPSCAAKTPRSSRRRRRTCSGGCRPLH